MKKLEDIYKKLMVRRTMPKTFVTTLGILSFSIIISLVISCSMSADGGKVLVLSPIIITLIIIFIIFPYSLLYSLLTLFPKFSKKYAFIYNSILGTIYIIHTVLYYKINWLAINTGERQISHFESYLYGARWHYGLFLLFIVMQLFISLFFIYKHKK